MAKRSNNPLHNFSLPSSLKCYTDHRSSNSDDDSTATLPNSSSLPTLFLKWGTQRKVGCTRRSSASNSSDDDSTATTWNNPLHNFSSLPSFLNWGTQCTAVGGAALWRRTPTRWCGRS
ncbi:hypothetical protein GYH30_052247 [Glycine max]|nr:hypothetical protein GYH30_052247 [Glycine max]